jgi:PIN domain nuclease of toxin-antitoxin system
VIAVLDASALIAMLLFEPGWESVAAVHSDSLASSVNIAEVVTKLSERGLADDDARLAISRLELSIADFERSRRCKLGCFAGRHGRAASRSGIEPVWASRSPAASVCSRPTGPWWGWSSASRSR